MRYFYIFILTLILISCNEKKGYSHTPVIEFGEGVYGISLSECRDVVVKGKIIREIQNSDTKSFLTNILNISVFQYFSQQIPSLGTINHTFGVKHNKRHTTIFNHFIRVD